MPKAVEIGMGVGVSAVLFAVAYKIVTSKEVKGKFSFRKDLVGIDAEVELT